MQTIQDKATQGVEAAKEVFTASEQHEADTATDRLQHRACEAKQTVGDRAGEAKKYIEEKAAFHDSDAEKKRAEREATQKANRTKEAIQEHTNKASEAFHESSVGGVVKEVAAVVSDKVSQGVQTLRSACGTRRAECALDEVKNKLGEARLAAGNRASEAKTYIEEKASTDDRDATAKRVEREAVRRRNQANENIVQTKNKAVTNAKDGARAFGEGLEKTKEQATKAGA